MGQFLFTVFVIACTRGQWLGTMRETFVTLMKEEIARTWRAISTRGQIKRRILSSVAIVLSPDPTWRRLLDRYTGVSLFFSTLIKSTGRYYPLYGGGLRVRAGTSWWYKKWHPWPATRLRDVSNYQQPREHIRNTGMRWCSAPTYWHVKRYVGDR